MSAFNELTAEELSQWREHPVSRAFVEWVGAQAGIARDIVVDLTWAVKPDQARAQAGVVHGLEWLLAAVMRDPSVGKVATDAEAAFIDPSAPPPRKWGI